MLHSAGQTHRAGTLLEHGNLQSEFLTHSLVQRRRMRISSVRPVCCPCCCAFPRIQYFITFRDSCRRRYNRLFLLRQGRDVAPPPTVPAKHAALSTLDPWSWLRSEVPPSSSSSLPLPSRSAQLAHFASAECSGLGDVDRLPTNGKDVQSER